MLESDMEKLQIVSGGFLLYYSGTQIAVNVVIISHIIDSCSKSKLSYVVVLIKQVL